jgi:hypothetical protein
MTLIEGWVKPYASTSAAVRVARRTLAARIAEYARLLPDQVAVWLSV